MNNNRSFKSILEDLYAQQSLDNRPAYTTQLQKHNLLWAAICTVYLPGITRPFRASATSRRKKLACEKAAQKVVAEISHHVGAAGKCIIYKQNKIDNASPWSTSSVSTSKSSHSAQSLEQHEEEIEIAPPRSIRPVQLPSLQSYKNANITTAKSVLEELHAAKRLAKRADYQQAKRGNLWVCTCVARLSSVETTFREVGEAMRIKMACEVAAGKIARRIAPFLDHIGLSITSKLLLSPTSTTTPVLLVENHSDEEQHTIKRERGGNNNNNINGKALLEEMFARNEIAQRPHYVDEFHPVSGYWASNCTVCILLEGESECFYRQVGTARRKKDARELAARKITRRILSASNVDINININDDKCVENSIKSPKFDSNGVLIEDERDEISAADAHDVDDVDYVSALKKTREERADVFGELRYEYGVENEAQLNVCTASIYADKLDRVVVCTKRAKKRKKAVQAAARGLIQNILEIQPEATIVEEDRIEFGWVELLDILEVGEREAGDPEDDLTYAIVKKAAYTHHQAHDGTHWVVSCTVYIPGVYFAFTQTASSRSKNNAREIAAKNITLHNLLPYSSAVAQKEIMRLVRENLHLHPAEVPFGIGSSMGIAEGNEKEEPTSNYNYNNSYAIDGRKNGMKRIERENEDTCLPREEEKIAPSSTPGENYFKLPQGYNIGVARCTEDCTEFIDGLEDGEKLGVYLESKRVYESIVYGWHGKGEVEGEGEDGDGGGESSSMCQVVVLAAKSGALLLLEPMFHNNNNYTDNDNDNNSWPPLCVVNLLQSASVRCCGYMAECGARHLGFSHDNRHRVCALESLIDLIDLIEDGVELRPKAGFGDIVHAATGMRFGVECMGLQVDGKIEECIHLGEYRVRVGILTAVATLCAFDQVCSKGDEEVERHEMEGFGDLMDLLTGRSALF